VSEIIKGLPIGKAAYTWIFASFIAVGLFWLIVYPEITPPFERFDKLSAAGKSLIFLAVSIALGLTLNALSTVLYRFLEGYLWPGQRIRSVGIWWQTRKRDRLQRIQGKGDFISKGKKAEELWRIPNDHLLPTTLGNALRVPEKYGADRFNLESLILWQELCSVAPSYLLDELDRTRSRMDFFVALWYLSILFGAATAYVALRDHMKIDMVIVATLAFLSTVFWYRMTVVSSSYYGMTIKSLVNVGRIKLAEAFGLQLPQTIEEEREMWNLITHFVAQGLDAANENKLDRFRKPAEED
jgi:hypothetical protein